MATYDAQQNRVTEFLDNSEYLSRGIVINVFSVIAGLVLWEVAANNLGSILLAGPVAVANKLIELTVSLELLEAMWGSLQTLAIGYVLGLVLATALGFLMAQSKYVVWAVNPYIDALYTTPPIAYLPLVVVWFGLGFNARVFFVFVFCFFEILINVFEGVKTVQKDYMNVARSFDASWLATQRDVIFPAALPFVFAGYRLGIGRAVRGVIVAELFLRLVNIGKLLQAAGAVLNTSQQLAVVIAVAVMGVLLQRLVLTASHMIAPWYYVQHNKEA